MQTILPLSQPADPAPAQAPPGVRLPGDMAPAFWQLVAGDTPMPLESGDGAETDTTPSERPVRTGVTKAESPARIIDLAGSAAEGRVWPDARGVEVSREPSAQAAKDVFGSTNLLGSTSNPVSIGATKADGPVQAPAKDSPQVRSIESPVFPVTDNTSTVRGPSRAAEDVSPLEAEDGTIPPATASHRAIDISREPSQPAGPGTLPPIVARITTQGDTSDKQVEAEAPRQEKAPPQAVPANVDTGRISESPDFPPGADEVQLKPDVSDGLPRKSKAAESAPLNADRLDSGTTAPLATPAQWVPNDIEKSAEGDRRQPGEAAIGNPRDGQAVGLRTQRSEPEGQLATDPRQGATPTAVVAPRRAAPDAGASQPAAALPGRSVTLVTDRRPLTDAPVTPDHPPHRTVPAPDPVTVGPALSDQRIAVKAPDVQNRVVSEIRATPTTPLAAPHPMPEKPQVPPQVITLANGPVSAEPSVTDQGVVEKADVFMSLATSTGPASTTGAAPVVTAIPTAASGAALAQSAAQQILTSLTPLPDGVLEITLQPEELGRLRLSLSGGEAGHALMVSADREETLALLKRHEATLAREFEALGFGGLSLSFEQAGQQQGDDTPKNQQQDGLAQIPSPDPPDPAAGLVATARLDLRL